MNGKERDYGRVELVWTGKRREVERVRLPFQVIERVNDVRRSREGQAPILTAGPNLPDWWPEGWRNKLIWGDNKYVLASLLDDFAGKVDLIYIDPPFATGDNFTYRIQVGDADVSKLPSAIEELAYRDTWSQGIESYLAMLHDRLVLLRDLLSPDGSIWLHMDEHVGHYAKVIMDEVFGYGRYLNEIVWHYPDNFQGNVNRYANNHNVIYVYGNRNLKRQKVKLAKPRRRDRRVWDKESGQLVSERDSSGNLVYDTFDERYLDDVWTIGQTSVVQRRTTEYLPYDTQKPEQLLWNIIQSGTDEGALVLDCFMGSGTTAAVAEKLGRRWVGADIGRFAIQTTRKRLLDIAGCHPFEVLNLGRYERRYWQGVEAGEAVHDYYRFILELYGAQPIVGFTHLHGQRDGRFVHVGATEAPVTFDELKRTLEECTGNGVTAIDVLAWEWEMGLNPAGKNELATKNCVDLRLFHIPREVMDKRAVDAGDVHFFELSVVEVKAEVAKSAVEVEVTGFLPAIDEYMSEKVKGKVTKWSDWIDYWSVDFGFDGETFVNQWQAYRTRKDPMLGLRSDPHEYGVPGEYRIVVKVIDIFGNDTTHELRVNVE